MHLKTNTIDVKDKIKNDPVEIITEEFQLSSADIEKISNKAAKYGASLYWMSANLSKVIKAASRYSGKLVIDDNVTLLDIIGRIPIENMESFHNELLDLMIHSADFYFVDKQVDAKEIAEALWDSVEHHDDSISRIKDGKRAKASSLEEIGWPFEEWEWQDLPNIPVIGRSTKENSVTENVSNVACWAMSSSNSLTVENETVFDHKKYMLDSLKSFKSHLEWDDTYSVLGDQKRYRSSVLGDQKRYRLDKLESISVWEWPDTTGLVAKFNIHSCTDQCDYEEGDFVPFMSPSAGHPNFIYKQITCYYVK